jgi:hypothetical protein
MMMVFPKRLLHLIDQWRPYRVLRQPIFIVSAPRSGSTFLFEILRQDPHVWWTPQEIDSVWHKYFPYERSAESCDYVSGKEYNLRTARNIRHDHYHCGLWTRIGQGIDTGFRERFGLTRVRFLDKTIANCFRLEFIKKAFPDALYIFLLRDGRASVSSMMEGWKEKPKLFIKKALQPIVDRAQGSVRAWCYPAPPGWMEMLDRPLEEICAWLWCQHVLTASEQLRDVGEEQKLVLKYEDLTENLPEYVSRLAEFCRLNGINEQVVMDQRPLSRTTVSPPERDKWQKLHGREIESVLPTIAPIMKQFGYCV